MGQPIKELRGLIAYEFMSMFPYCKEKELARLGYSVGALAGSGILEKLRR